MRRALCDVSFEAPQHQGSKQEQAEASASGKRNEDSRVILAGDLFAELERQILLTSHIRHGFDQILGNLSLIGAVRRLQRLEESMQRHLGHVLPTRLLRIEPRAV